MTKAVFPLALLLLWSNSGNAGNCEDGATSMSEVRACLAAQSDASVKAAYAALLAKVEASNPQAAPALEASQRSWALFAKDSCDFHSEFNAAVSDRDDSRVNCWADFSRARIKVLKSWESRLDGRR